MKRETKERGVTLVALIITVIILVILAAVSIKEISDHRMAEVAINGTEDYIFEDLKDRISIAINESLLYNFDAEKVAFNYEALPEQAINLLRERRICMY